MNFLARFKYFDIPLVVAMGLLGLAGLAILYSISLSGEGLGEFWRQVGFFGVGAVLFLLLSHFDYARLTKLNRAFYLISLVLLIYLLAFGPEIRGGKRWLPLGFASIQLAEFAKLVVILGLARLLYVLRGQINSFKPLLWSFLYALVPALLVFFEPDFGSAAVIMAIWVGMIMISRIQKKYLAALFLIFLLAASSLWVFVLKDFQKDRVRVFINPELDVKGRGYNVRQAIIAVGSGQMWGRGLGQGLQSTYKFLPEKQTDFIFAAAGEEVGFIGLTALLGLYFLMFYRLAGVMQKAKDELGMYLVGGVFFYLLSHVVVNVGMNIGLLPVTGIPLPFLSSGGSALVVALCALGIVQNVAMQSKFLRF